MKSTLPRAANDADVNSKNCVKSCIMNRERERESAHVASQGSVNARGCWRIWSERAYMHIGERPTGRKLMVANKLTTLPPEWPSIKGMGAVINLKNPLRPPLRRERERECSLARCNSSELFFSFVHLSAMWIHMRVREAQFYIYNARVHLSH